MILGLSIGLNRPKTFLANVNPIVSIPYNYVTTPGQFPPAGSIYVQSGSLNIRINEVDVNGVNHGGYLSLADAGDIIQIGPQEGILATRPHNSGGVWLVSVTVWPVLVDNLYNVSLTFAPPAGSYGPELVANGTFDVDTSGWAAVAGAVLAVDAGQMSVANTTASYGGASQVIPVVSGKTYKVTWKARKTTADCSFAFIDVVGGPYNIPVTTTTMDSYEDTVVATAATIQLKCQVHLTIGPLSYFDDISVKEVL